MDADMTERLIAIIYVQIVINIVLVLMNIAWLVHVWGHG